MTADYLYQTPYSYNSRWEPPLNPPCDPYEEEKQKLIFSVIEDFAEQVVRHGSQSTKLGKEETNFVDMLYEYIEDNIEKFTPEPCYDDYL